MTRRNSAKDRKACFDAHAYDDPARMNCYLCGKVMDLARDAWEAEHVIPLAFGGAELLPVCRPCHKHKTASDLGKIAKAKRGNAKHTGVWRSRRPMAGGKASGWRKRMNGTVKRRQLPDSLD